MPGHSFFVTPKNFSATTALLTGDESHHLQKVLRLKIGEQVRIFDGLGQDWLATIKEFNGKNVYLSLVERLEEVESPIKITLVQGLIKGERFEWAIQKAVELGVSIIQPLISQHTDIKPGKGLIDSRLERWERIVLEATKQSKRNVLTKICQPIEWSVLLNEQKNSPTIFFTELGGTSLSQAIGEIKKDFLGSITLVVGSEGGWSEKEILEASQKGFYPATFGKRILRAETAAITAVGLVQHLLGDLD